MIKLIYNNKAFDILGGFDITSSNNEVTFNDITIDFTGYTLEDMPLKYQEIKIKQCREKQDILKEGDVLFFGYVDSIELGKMQMEEEDRELTITLLSPLKLATLRTVSVNGTFLVEDLILRVLEPLVNDGFKIEEINVDEGRMTVNYIMQSIEACMNDLSLKKSIFWRIDKNKKIYVNSINYLFNKKVSKEIVNASEEGLLKIEPLIEGTDYANVINIKNARVIYSVYSSEEVSNDFEVLSLPKTIKKGDIIEFNYPIVLSLQYLKMLKEEHKSASSIPLIYLTINNEVFSIYYNLGYETFEYNGSFTFSDSDGEEGDIVLQRDSFFTNLITGFKWNGSEQAIITYASSYSALRYSKVKFMNSEEIEKLKGVISQSGQIEKTVDAHETWFTNQSLLDYARNLLIKNTNDINTVNLAYDIDYNLEVGDIVKIELPKFYVSGKYAITKIRYIYNSEYDQLWEITLKKSELLDLYINIFRPNESLNNDERQDSLIISEYVTEGVEEIHEIESTASNILNFNLNQVL